MLNKDLKMKTGEVDFCNGSLRSRLGDVVEFENRPPGTDAA